MNNTTGHIENYDAIQLPNIPEIPGMISEYEAKYLYWLTSNYFTGQGEIVELGTWLGKSSAYLGAGLRDSGKSVALNCYDLYLWNRNFNAHHLVRQSGLYLDHGADFQPYFEKNVRQVYTNLKVNKVSLERIKWTGGAIEILFVDAPKSQKTICAVLEIFGEHLIPGVSIVVMQDFLHAPSYPLALVFSELHEELEYLHAVPYSSSAAFKVKKKVSITRNDSKFNINAWPKEKILKSFDRIIHLLPEQSQDYLKPGVAMSLLDIGQVKDCAHYMARINLHKPGIKRLNFLMGLQQYYAAYKLVFDSYFYDSNLFFEESIILLDGDVKLLNEAKVKNDERGIAISSLKGGVAMKKLSNAINKTITVNAQIIGDPLNHKSNGYIVFSDDDINNRVCVGIHYGKNEIWIEEHPGGMFGVESVRKRAKESVKGRTKITVDVNLEKRIIVCRAGGEVLYSTFKSGLKRIQWIGFRVYDTTTIFSSINVIGL